MRKISIIFFVLISCLFFNGIVFAQGQLLPAFILGSVTNNGSLAQAGQTLYIMNNNVVIISTSINNKGRFGPIEILEPDIKIINFKLDNERINETYIWESGKIDDLTLTVDVSNNIIPPTISAISEIPPTISATITTSAISQATPQLILGNQGIVGEQGEQGEPGDVGKQGVAGNQGSRGLDGMQGAQGILGVQGQQGIMGIPGELGEIGEQGETGNKGQSNKLINGFGILVGIISIIFALYIYREVKNIS